MINMLFSLVTPFKSSTTIMLSDQLIPMNSVSLVRVPMENQMEHASSKVGIPISQFFLSEILIIFLKKEFRIMFLGDPLKLTLIYLQMTTMEPFPVLIRKFLVLWVKILQSMICKVTDAGQSDGEKQPKMVLETILLKYVTYIEFKKNNEKN